MNKCTRKLEVCVDSFAGLMAARKGGADRIELCSSFTEGGLTPSAGLMQAAAQIGIPSHVMIRPRNGDFNYDRHDIEIMAHDISNVHLYNLKVLYSGSKMDPAT
jgi:copper homeostasis protein